jgi:hydroxyacylglutathione hydrolase
MPASRHCTQPAPPADTPTMPAFTPLALPAFDDNYIWALAGDDGDALVVDPGDAAPVLAAMAQGLRPTTVLITHHHHDHIGGIAALTAAIPGLEIVAPQDERIPLATRRVGDGDVVRAAGLDFRTLAVPGHTRSHIAFHADDAGTAPLLFCGDTLFSLGCGRLFEGTPAQMLASLDRLAALPGDTRICCTHEYTLSNAAFALAVDPHNPALLARVDEVRDLRARQQPTLPVTLARERATNPFLRCDDAAVRAAIAARLGRPPADRIETFAVLREWKNVFRA